jgi:hypothetical protein
MSPIDLESWWSNIAGQLPESRLTKPKEGLDEVAGPTTTPDLNPATLTLRCQSSRVDWILEANNPEVPFSTEIPHLGPFTEALRLFNHMLDPWIRALPSPLLRLALGAILTLPVENHEQGYIVLSGFLPFSLDTDSSDFLYRINRPVLSHCLADQTRINRLSTWSVMEMRHFGFTVSPDVSGPEPILPQPPSSFACRLELDVNTKPDTIEPIPPDKHHDLLSEFSAIALSLAEEGDHP